MKFRHLRALRARDERFFGAKAVRCGLLLRAGFPVPEGFALTLAPGETVEIAGEVETWARSVGRLAVRSSAAGEDAAGSSFAGVYESYLDVGPDDLRKAIAGCAASFASERARRYRALRGLPARTRGAVLVQRMIEPAVSGVAFSADPVSGDRAAIVINAARGRGDDVVAGRAAAQEIRVRRRGDGIDAGSLHDTILGAERLAALAAAVIRIEAHFGAPQDIEWCDDGQVCWILQSRPITTLNKPEIEWTRAGVREVMPDLSPPHVAETAAAMVDSTYRRMYGPFFAPREQLGALARTICGRIYLNLTQLRRMGRLSGLPEAVVLRAYGLADLVTPADEAPPRRTWRERLLVLPTSLRHNSLQLRLRSRFDRSLGALQSAGRRIASLDLDNTADDALLRTIVHWRDGMSERMETPSILLDAAMDDEPLRELCSAAGIDPDTLLHARLASGEPSIAAQQGFDLLRVARAIRDGAGFDEQLAWYLDRYGHRGVFEADWSLPRFAEDPAPIVAAVRAHLAEAEIASPDAIRQRQEREWSAVWQQAAAKLPAVKAKKLRSLLDRMKQLFLDRESYRSELLRAGFHIRRVHGALAARLVQRRRIDQLSDYFFLLPAEVAAAFGGASVDLTALVRSRREEQQRWRGMNMPIVLRDSEIPELERGSGAAPPAPQRGGELRGLCVSRGAAEGVATIILHPSNVDRMLKGSILVAPAIDQSWVPLFTLASGVIVEVGGTLSHAAIVLRELSVPALTNVDDATVRLRDGQRIRLDATNGRVDVL